MAADASSEAAVLAALEALYHPTPQPSTQRAADAFLRGFQLSPAAFGVCAALLERFLPSASSAASSAQPTPVLFFAAQTLATKLRRQHAFPPAWSHLALSERLVAWLALAPPKLVHTQLVLALVACLPRIPPLELQARAAASPTTSTSTSSGPTGSITALLSAASGTDSSGVLSFVLGALARAQVAPATLAELLVVVVEEAAEIPERSARERLRAEVAQWAVPVLDQLLPQLMQEAATAAAAAGSHRQHQAEAVATQQTVLRAAKNWLRYASVSPGVVVRNPLLQSFVAFLNQDDLFDVAVDLVVELVRSYHDVQRDLVLVQWLVPQLMQLRDAFQRAAAADDTDTCLGLCRIFTEMAEAYLPLLVGDLEMGQAAVVGLLLDCMSCPDVEVADVTVPFWFRFIEELLRTERAERDAALGKLAPSLLRLAGICMQHLQFQDAFPRLPADKQQDFKLFRHELGDILRDVCELLGAEAILQHCVQGLEQIFQQPAEQRRWEAIEAHLFAFRSIARHVERANPEAVNAPVELIFQHLPRFSEHPAICYTSCLIVSRYVAWLQQHPAFLPAQLAFLNQNVMSSTQDPRFADWDVARAAAAAIRSIATDCWPLVGREVTAFYLHLEAHDILAVDDQTFILEGVLAGVASTRDLGAVLGLLEQVLEPIGQRLSALLTAAATGASVSPAAAAVELSRLICIYDHLDVDMRAMGGGGGAETPHPLMTLTEKVWPLFNQLLLLFRGKDDLVERVCRCYKRILRTCGSQFKPFLPQLVDNLLAFYQSDPKSSYLYAGNMVLKYFGRDESDEVVNLFAKLLRVFAETTFPIFKARATVQAHPDVVEEFFFLVQRSLTCVPQVLLAPWSTDGAPLLNSLFQCAVVSLEVSHNEANKAALCFLEEMLVLGLQTCSNPTPRLAAFESVLEQSFFAGESCGGQQLVNHLLSGVVLGTVPVSRLDADYGSVAGVLVQFAKLDGQRLQEWMSAWFVEAVTMGNPPPAGFLTSDEAGEFQRDLFSSSSERSFRRVARHFGKLCASRNTAFKGDDD
ncbi:hypothetical protein PybrP1_008967 [[Pythium] brassicae (nom. inval.)]|nr:hypothetical protein PybrP1_008967 [[Pythium] brassicae (nom. inval.)]